MLDELHIRQPELFNNFKYLMFRVCIKEDFEKLKRSSIASNRDLKTLSNFFMPLCECIRRYSNQDYEIWAWNQIHQNEPDKIININISMATSTPILHYGLAAGMHSYVLQRLLHEVLTPKPIISQSNEERVQAQQNLMIDYTPMEDVANQFTQELRQNSDVNRFQFDVFVSYKWKDSSAAVVKLIIDELLKRGLRVAYDRNELQTGESIYDELRRLMIASRYIVACISPAYCDSENCLWELRTAKELYKKIFPCKITMTTSWPPEISRLLPNILYKEFSIIRVNWDDLAVELVSDVVGELQGKNH